MPEGNLEESWEASNGKLNSSEETLLRAILWDQEARKKKKTNETTTHSLGFVVCDVGFVVLSFFF